MERPGSPPFSARALLLERMGWMEGAKELGGSGLGIMRVCIPVQWWDPCAQGGWGKEDSVSGMGSCVGRRAPPVRARLG